MFINKIASGIQKTVFKGFQHGVNNVGEDIMRFNYPYDYEKETCEVQFFRVKKLENGELSLDETLVASIPLKEGGTDVNIQDIANFDKDEPFAYRFVRKNKETKELIGEHYDSGLLLAVQKGKAKVIETLQQFYDSQNCPKYSFVTRNGTTPRVQGAAYHSFPDSQRVGVYYHGFDAPNTGEIYVDKDAQKNLEGAVRTFSNKYGGNLAGLEYNLDYLAKMGYKVNVVNPIVGGDNKSSHHYWNKNNFQISDDMGNVENFASYTKKLFQKGIKYVYDGTYTSEGLEGIHFQYALRWAGKDPQSYYWFRMTGLKDSNLGFGVVPQNKENLRFRLINAPKSLDEGTNKLVDNPDYNPNKETYIQIYDASQVSDEQLSKLDKPIENYVNLKSGNPLAINSHDDTLINYICQVDPKEVVGRFNEFVDFNKNNQEPMKLNSPDGTIFFAQFSNFRFDKKTEGGFVAWDANTDMVKMNYHISGYDEKLNQAIVDRTQRDYVKMLQERGAYEVQDMALQAGKYWTSKVKDIQTLYAAQALKGKTTSEGLKELISTGILPEESFMEQEVIDNIVNGYYLLSPKGKLDKDSTTVKALMKLPMDTLEFAENTVGVLSTSFFSNRATSEETLGLTRFELMQKENPHLVEPYSKVYSRMNSLISNEIKKFADEVINKINVNSEEKLIDENGNYTEYGEYVIELIGQDVAKYTLLKSLTGDKLKTKILANGEITYDYVNIKDLTSLKSLGINANNPADEAKQLLGLIEKGLLKLNSKDIDYVTESVSKRISGTNLNSFRIAEAIVKRAGLGLDWRLDAAKDVIDMDAVRNGDNHFDEAWQNVINFWKIFVQKVKEENPNSNIIAEITDVQYLMQDTYGENFNGYNHTYDVGNKFHSVPETMMKLFNETGITTEAAYSYFFTDLVKTFGPNFENGEIQGDAQARANSFIARLNELIHTRGIDYVRNLYTFVGNHDKPRLLHGLSLDMALFHGALRVYDRDGNLNYDLNRKNRLESLLQLTNSDKYADLPLEAKLNIDNQDYFLTVSTRAVAMSQILRYAINDALRGLATDEEIKYLKSALVDLTNGNYLDGGVTTQIPSINIPELSSFENALKEMLKMAGITLSQSEFDAIIRVANNPELIEKFVIHGDFDWDGANAEIGNKNRNNLEKLLRGAQEDIASGENNYKKYSTYSTAVAGILREAFLEVKGNDVTAKSKFLNAGRDFVKKFDREFVESRRTKLPYEESYRDAMIKNSYAAHIESAVQMLVQQAEFKARKDGKLADGQHFANTDKILANVFKNATEPGVQKSIMAMAYLSALVGNPTLYGGDELGMSGYEEKAKNIYLKNRNALPWTELQEGVFKDYRNEIYRRMNEAMGIRSRDGVDALNNGTPYLLTEANDGNLPAFMMQDGYGNMTVSIFNAYGISPLHRFDYFEELGIDDSNKSKFFTENYIDSINPNNRFVPIQKNKDVDYIELATGIALPIGLIFMNSDSRDKTLYEIREFINKENKKALGIFKKGGGKISVNNMTAKNGVMILKHVKNAGRKLVFRGNTVGYNKQFNLVSNPYQKINNPIEGEKLFLLAR